MREESREQRGEMGEAGGETQPTPDPSRTQDRTRNPKPETRSAELETHLLFAVVSIIAWWVLRIDWILLIGLGFGAIGLFIKPLAKWIDWGWRKFSEGLGWVMSRVVMGVIYILVLVPIAFLAQRSRKDPLMLKQQETYWHKREKKFEREDLEKMW